jgi:hypothetical protein
MANLSIPCYDKLSKYNFHDTVAATCKYVFAHTAKVEFKERQDRIKSLKSAGLEMSKFDKMTEDSPAFWKLNDT